MIQNARKSLNLRKMAAEREVVNEIAAEAEGSYELNKFLLAEHQNLIIHKAVFKFEQINAFQKHEMWYMHLHLDK